MWYPVLAISAGVDNTDNLFLWQAAFSCILASLGLLLWIMIMDNPFLG